MASRSMRASYEAPRVRKGRMPLFSNADTTWDVFRDGSELVDVTDPYEFPTFYHTAVREDGTLHVVSVESYEYPVEPWEDQELLERQLERVRGMELVDADDPDFRSAIRAMRWYVMDESPEARARADKRWEEVQANVRRELAEARASKPKKFRVLPHERSVPKRSLIGGLFLTFGGDR